MTSAVTSAVIATGVTTDGDRAATAIVMTVGRVNRTIGTTIVMTDHDRIVTMTGIAPIVIVIATARTGTAQTVTRLNATVRGTTATATAMQAAPIRARMTGVLHATITATFALLGLLSGSHPALRKRCTTNQGDAKSATSPGDQ